MVYPTLDFEEKYWKDNTLCIGVDEVGRGPVAGPIVAASVAYDINKDLQNEALDSGIIVRDSKTMSRQQHQKAYSWILQHAKSYSIVSVSSNTIDTIGIQKANYSSMVSAVNRLCTKMGGLTNIVVLSDLVLGLDKLVDLSLKWQSIVRGDSHSFTIASASILAKHYRDMYMVKQARTYPQYGWDRNMGYGTKSHMEAIRAFGLTPLHRRSFLTKM